MKSLLKKMLPALALTLMIAGTITASAIGTAKTNHVVGQWYGLPETGGPILLNPNEEPDPLTDCDETEHNCYQLVDGQTTTPYPGGFYKIQ